MLWVSTANLPFHFSYVIKHPLTTGISPLSLHDALPISEKTVPSFLGKPIRAVIEESEKAGLEIDVFDHRDRKSTRLNSSHANISYAVFCLKKKNGRPHCCARPSSDS